MRIRAAVDFADTHFVATKARYLCPRRIDNRHTEGSPVRSTSSSLVQGAFAHQAGDLPTSDPKTYAIFGQSAFAACEGLQQGL